MSAAAGTSKARSDSAVSSNVRNTKILIAEDSEILNNMMKDFFEENGFDVVQAFDGLECKSVFLRELPDVAFLDVQMPKLDGIEALRFIKEKAPRTIVVVMTAWGNDQTAVKAMKFRADEYLNKPFSMRDILGLTQNLLEKRRVNDENIRLKHEVGRWERYLAHLTTIINEALVTTDSQGRIEFINRAAADMWGYSLEELKDKDIHFLVRGEARTLLYRDLVKDTIQKKRLEGEFHFRKKDNSTFPGYLSSSVILEKDRPRGIVVVVADLTRLHAVERRLKQSEKLASLGKVVEGVAHEVRNCLTSLGGFTRRLQNILSHDATCHQYTQIMLDDVSRLERMVREIEDYVRFSKFYTFQFQRILVPAVIQKARERALARVSPEHAKSVSVMFNADRDLRKISADPVALEEAFYNLILNAYEAMPGGGKLKILAKNINSAVSVSFTDTGVGIPDQDLTEIFNPFFTTKTTGAGMGLSKVYLLVEEHGGAVNVHSDRGRGTTFEVFLPTERLMTGLHPWEAATRGGPHR
jgi:PAS domain S-box-containing protein